MQKISSFSAVLSVIVSFFTIFSSLAQTGLSEIVKDNFAVVKHTPENPFHIRVDIYLDNKGETERNGELRLEAFHHDGSLTFDSAMPVRLDSGKRSVFPFETVLPVYDEYTFHYTYTETQGNAGVATSFMETPGNAGVAASFTETPGNAGVAALASDTNYLENSFTWLTEPVNFFYAFTTPHRLTVCLPDNGNKTLLDVKNGAVSFVWSFDNLDYYPYDSFREVKSMWQINIQPELNGKPFEHSSWTRANGYLPILKNIYESDEVELILEACGAEKAAVVKVTIHNKTNQPQHVRLPCIRPGNWTGYNYGWIDETQATDNLLAGWRAPADQVIILGIGADAYPTDPVNTCQMNMDWNVAPGKTGEGWLIRPYNSFYSELDDLRKTDWEAQFRDGHSVWEELLAPVSKIYVPDKKLSDAFYAGIADFFVMREPVGKGYIAIVPGTDGYRSAPNATETAIVTVALSQIGLAKEAEKGYRVCWDLQDEDGNWNELGGWAHLMWVTTGFKAWAAIEYYLNTLDKSFLEKRFPQMQAASRWQDNMRRRTKTLLPSGERPLTYGLMPKGMGDGGLLDDGSYYGIFFSHNIMAVYADSLAERAARILGKEQEADELRNIYLSAKADLLTSMERGAIVEPDGTHWLSSVPGKITGSCWGLLASIHPTGLLAPDNELITNTLNRIEQQMSPGGLPIHTGWMVDGMWVAITLNDFAQVHLAKDEPEKALSYLYATLNHGTPLYSWCEERGQFPGTSQLSGDLQHLWTPVAVVRFLRDMLVMEDDHTLHLARGISRGWLSGGEPVGIENASTRFGNISYKIRYDARRSQLTGRIHFPEGRPSVETILHCPLPKGMKLTKTSAGKLLPDRSGIVFTNGKGIIDFNITVRK